jgi:hypothetical protein
MISSPSILEEMSFIAYFLRRDKEVFKAAVRGFDVFKVQPSVVIYHKKLNLMNAFDPIASLVRRASTIDIEKIAKLNWKLMDLD